MAAAAAAIAAAIGMAGAQTTVNNQLKAATATATATVMMTATAMTMETKASTAVEAPQQRKGSGRLGGSGGSLGRALLAAVAARWGHRQRQCGSGSAAAAKTARLTPEAAAWQKRDFGGSGSALGSAASA